MRFWDTSAIVPLLVVESHSIKSRHWFREDPQVLLWAFTVVEVMSALCRRQRQGEMTPVEFGEAKQRLGFLQKGWTEVSLGEAVRERALRVIGVHALKAGDALQLGAALISCHDHPAGMTFLSFDPQLRKAAEREGFAVPL